MDPIWLLVPVFFLIFWLTDKLLEKPMNRLLSMVGLGSLHGGIGPLESHAVVEDEKMIVRVRNAGRDKIRLGSVVGTGSRRKPYCPVPYLRDDHFGDRDLDHAIRREFTSIILKPGESLEFTLSVSKLVENGCKQLKIFNTRGRSWPVEGLPTTLNPVSEGSSQ